ncbi:S-layer homology domain-containing protein [Fusibacter ferrireducens]|uniref:S-layer homology domain-containing protein n=1 Tax=Fusibacter ferrireducens TaxID=2785058 RepID=A0ABR9ZYE6_9FIRM|nr:S-layer homology domain-containing protein [Fusibacter ferrireducens]MBF4695178.1 S-layer homology domain-containing protein [Fusibacter ferrireducens]
MKKVLSLVLVLAMVLGMMPVFAAGETGAEQLYKYGFIAGNNGDLMVDKELTRAEMAVLVAEMNGLKEEAANYAAPADFNDVEAGKWYTPYVAYGQANGWWSGYPDGSFKPEIGMSGQEFAAVLMNALKYDFTWNTVVADAAAIGVDVQTASFNRGAAFEAMWAAVNKPVKGEEVALGVKLGRLESAMTPAGALAVESIKAASSKSITVKFNKAVTEADKITFAVKRSSTPVTVVTAWNEEKTVATLSSASNFAEAAYVATVAADGKDVATETITFTQQKVAKIEFTSPSVAVTVSGTPTGYVTYKVYDQYENDITSTSMANTLSPQVGVNTAGGSLTIKNGLMTIVPAPGTNLMTFQAISIVLYDASAGVTATKSLPVSTVTGTLTEFALGSAENLQIVENDTTSVYYLPYTAKDMAGNETKSYELVKEGLIDGDGSLDGTQLVSSLSNVVAAIVKDPANSKNAAIEVRYVGSTSNSMDMPLTLTAMTYTGSNSSIQSKVVKAKAIDKIILLAPAEVVSVSEGNVVIPFEAYDVQGNLVKEYTYVSKVTLQGGDSTTNIRWIEQSNGDASLVFTAPSNTGVITFTATSPSSKMSNMLSINVQKQAYPASIGFKSSGIIPAMENTAIQKIDFAGGKDEDLVIYDQYDRAMSKSKINAALAGTFTLTASTSNTNVAFLGTDVNGNNAFDAATDLGGTPVVSGGKTVGFTKALTTAADFKIAASASSGGAASVEFTLKDGTKVMDSTSVSISVIETEDVKSYTVNTSDKAIYAVGANATIVPPAKVSAQDSEYSFDAEVYGATQSGTKVLLAGKPIVDAGLSNTTEFTLNSATVNTTFDGISVTALDPTGDKTEATTTLTITVKHNNVVKSLPVAIKSSDVKPVPTSVVVDGADDDGIFDEAGVQTIVAGTSRTLILTKYDSNRATSNNKVGGVETDILDFYIKDSYGTKGMSFSSFQIAKITNSAGVAYTGADLSSRLAELTITPNTTNLVYTAGGNIKTNDKIYITGVANNGMSATVAIIVK